MSLSLTFCILQSIVFAQNKDRTINWWVNVVGNTSTDQANIAAIMQHKELFTQVQVAWQPGCTSDGDLSAWWWQSEQVETWLSLYKPLNIPIVPAVICIVNSTIMHDKIYPNATDFALTLVDIANSFGFSGYTFDYEPQTPTDNNANSAELYKEFLYTVSNIFHKNNLILTAWVADWSKALNNYGLLAESGIDELQDMETYFGNLMKFHQTRH